MDKEKVSRKHGRIFRLEKHQIEQNLYMNTKASIEMVLLKHIPIQSALILAVRREAHSHRKIGKPIKQ